MSLCVEGGGVKEEREKHKHLKYGPLICNTGMHFTLFLHHFLHSSTHPDSFYVPNPIRRLIVLTGVTATGERCDWMLSAVLVDNLRVTERAQKGGWSVLKGLSVTQEKCGGERNSLISQDTRKKSYQNNLKAALLSACMSVSAGLTAELWIWWSGACFVYE